MYRLPKTIPLQSIQPRQAKRLGSHQLENSNATLIPLLYTVSTSASLCFCCNELLVDFASSLQTHGRVRQKIVAVTVAEGCTVCFCCAGMAASAAQSEGCSARWHAALGVTGLAPGFIVWYIPQLLLFREQKERESFHLPELGGETQAM